MSEQAQKSGKTAKEIAYYNNKLVANLLYEKPHSCIELSKETGLSHTAQNTIVNRLSDLQLVKTYKNPVNSPKPKGGQHNRYTINENRGVLICVHLHLHSDKLNVYDFKKNLLYSMDLNLNIHITETDITYIANKIKAGLRENHIDIPVLSIAVAIPGQVDSTNGNIIISSRLEHNKNVITPALQSVFHCPITIYNDTIYLAKGDMIDNKNLDNESVLYVNTDFYGLATALYHNGNFVTSKIGFSGEIGMNIITSKNTNLHVVCVMSAIAEKYEGILPSITTNGILEASRKNEQLFTELCESASILGNELRSYKNLVGLDKIVIYGESAKMDQSYIKALESAFNEDTAPEFKKTNFFYFPDSQQKTNLGLVEAACEVALENILKNYQKTY